MKQIIQHLNSGETSLIEVPAPMVKEGHLLIQTSFSLVSAGTERMLIEFGKANWISKALQQPDRVKGVWDKVKTDGLIPTLEAVRNKINQPIPLGYSNAGIVIAIGENVTGFKMGDRVVSNGSHAEIVQVPQNLCCKIPDTVSDETASFTVVAAIALQGIRLVQPTFGETVVVIGLGLIGQIAVQLLIANGCRVIGIDTREHRCAQAEIFGAITICNKNNEPVAQKILAYTGQSGADAVLITASSKDNTIIADAAAMSRKRGRIVLVGVTGLSLERSAFYEKELTFQVSCSYGPGRYDYDYEQKSNDYPIGFVRWTAKRNFEAVLHAMATGQLKVDPLITQKICLKEYIKVYDTIADPHNMASLLEYDVSRKHNTCVSFATPHANSSAEVALIGAGNFAGKVIVPCLQNTGTVINTIASANGLSAGQLAKRSGVAYATTDLTNIWNNKAVGTVLIATQHNIHAELCIKALESGKDVFVEKPLAINLPQLNAIKSAYEKAQRIINVGFNRRHAPLAVSMKKLLGNEHAKMNIVITVNAGIIPINNWLNDPETSGGRIVGEVCHFIDLAAFLTGSEVVAVCANSFDNSEDDATILLRFKNGSTASVHYFTNGHKAYHKERVEVYSEGKTLVLENWKRLSGYGFKGFSSSSSVQDKGHSREFKLLGERIKNGGKALIPFESLYNTSATAIAALQSLKEQKWVVV